jgi:pilus assembly protein CpaE
MAMLAIANEIFLVVTPEVGPIRNAAQFLDVARQVGLAGAVRVIVNRSNHGVSLQDIASSLGQPVSATVVSNGPFAVAAANEGVPIVTKFPGIRMSADLHGVARLLTQEITSATAPAGRPWWATLAARLTSA